MKPLLILLITISLTSALWFFVQKGGNVDGDGSLRYSATFSLPEASDVSSPYFINLIKLIRSKSFLVDLANEKKINFSNTQIALLNEVNWEPRVEIDSNSISVYFRENGNWSKGQYKDFQLAMRDISKVVEFEIKENKQEE